MAGRILWRQKCPICGSTGKHHPETLICQCGQFPTPADKVKLEIELIWRRKRCRITHDAQGHRIAGYHDAQQVLGQVRQAIKNQTFDPMDWKSLRGNRLLWPNFVKDYMAREKTRLLPGRKATYDKKRALSKHIGTAFEINLKELRSYHIKDWIESPELKSKLAPKGLSDILCKSHSV